MIRIREMFKYGSYISLHDGGGRFASKSQDIVGGEGGGAPVASKEGDGGVCDASMLTDVRLYLFKKGSGISVKGLVKGDACVTSFAPNDPSGCIGPSQTR